MMPKSKRQAYLSGSGEFLQSDACMLLSGERPSLSPTHTQGWKHFMLHYSCKERRFTSHHSFVAYDGFFSVVFWVQTCCEQCFYLICKYRDGYIQIIAFFFAKKSSIDFKCAASERKKKSNEHIFINMMVISFWRLYKCFVFALIFFSSPQ